MKSLRAWQDSNLQSSDPKSDVLTIRPHELIILNESKISILQDQCIEKFWFLIYLITLFIYPYVFIIALNNYKKINR